jgi:DNA-directed RNA polymerase delta subunit
VNKVVLENILGEWGHHKWPHINPKSVKDKAYLALKRENKPLHFTEITAKINSFWTSKKPTNNQTVHNELIKDGRFVLIGRGIYALKEWGYRPGVVLDVIMEIMKEKGGAMDQEEIIKGVMERRRVKRNTIVLNLQNKKNFEKLPNKVYRLK